MFDDNWQGNASTIVKFAWMILAPYLAEILTEDQFTVIGVAVIGLIIACWDAFNPNSMKIFKNEKKDECVCEVETEADLINEDYYAEEEYE